MLRARPVVLEGAIPAMLPRLTRLSPYLLPVVTAVALAACAPAAAPSPPVPAPPPTPAPPAPTPAAPAAPAQPAAKPAGSPVPTAAYDERAVADFYRGRTLRLVVGLAAGGGFDTIYRLWGRYAAKYIPGQPTIVVDNMTGAGGLVAANYLYNSAPKDGSTMGTMDMFITVLGQAAGAPGVELDANKFNFVGNPGDEAPVICAIRSDLGFNAFSEVL